MNTSLDLVRNHVAKALDLIERIECTLEPDDTSIGKMQSQLLHSELATVLLAAGAAAIHVLFEKTRWWPRESTDRR